MFQLLSTRRYPSLDFGNFGMDLNNLRETTKDSFENYNRVVNGDSLMMSHHNVLIISHIRI